MMISRSTAAVLILISLVVIRVDAQTTYTPVFDGNNAYEYLIAQCSFGPRPPGSENLTLCRAYISETLQSFGWNITLQNFTYRDTPCANIVATWGASANSSLILGAHYDTRPEATSDPDPLNRTKPILGANDGASGTAVLIELAHILPESVRSRVELVFFDAEDSGGINGWDWIQGSSYYVSTLNASQRAAFHAMILVDMVGDTNLQLPRETSSTTSLQDVIWSFAAEIGYDNIFLDSAGASITDDHTPFLQAGIPAVDLIQYPFPEYWHTLEDTPNKCNAQSLEAVGQVLEVFTVDDAAKNPTYPLDTSLVLYLTIIAVPALAIIIIILLRQKR